MILIVPAWVLLPQSPARIDDMALKNAGKAAATG